MSNEKNLDVHPLVDVSDKKVKKLSPIKIGIISVIVSYIAIGYLFYDYYKNKENSNPTLNVVEEYLKIDDVIKAVENSLRSNLTLDIKEVRTEEEIIQDLAQKSINLPDLKQTIDKTLNLPPPQPSQIPPAPQPLQLPLSRYDYFIQKARDYESMGNYKYAIFFYLRAFAENQKDYETKYKVAQLYYILGQIQLAAESAKDSLSIKPDYLPALQFLSEIYLKTGYKHQQLKTFLEQNINKYPNEKTLLYALAKIYKEENNLEGYNQIMSKIESKQ
ncbi:hypothetical protein [Sulfurihydrogenibium subterraneum]|uniref:hypothetical protein n=1 Tax=Sulfurihydrogenibium subterraneum TaxID=171121 RepID=UPI000490E960|nr:hypothetical protein [Sulfurihydrogenibium subterraneum]